MFLFHIINTILEWKIETKKLLHKKVKSHWAMEKEYKLCLKKKMPKVFSMVDNDTIRCENLNTMNLDPSGRNRHCNK